jgi:hypothetical protein
MEDRETVLGREPYTRYHTRPTYNVAPLPQQCPARGAHHRLAHPDDHVDQLDLPRLRTNLQLPSDPHHLPLSPHQALMYQMRK